MKLTLECEREEDGRWLAEVVELPGVLSYGETSSEALARAEVLALRVLAEQIEHGEFVWAEEAQRLSTAELVIPPFPRLQTREAGCECGLTASVPERQDRGKSSGRDES